MGRPRKAGKRNAKGRLIIMPDRGNVMIQVRSARFARFQGGKADQQVHDSIGRLWAVGLLDGFGYDGAILRDVGRRYAQLYWHEFAVMCPTISKSERQSRGGMNEGGSDAAGRAFEALDDMARSAGHSAVVAMHALCVDPWWFPDTDAPWIGRMVSAAIEGGIAQASDHLRLSNAILGLVAMAGGNGAKTNTLPLRRACA